MTASRRRDDGFSLVELLVVIVILGILSAIVIPSFLGQAEKAARAAMAADLNSLRLAQESRGTENDPMYTVDLAALAQEGFVRSDGVSEPQISLWDGNNQFLACVTHSRVDVWLVYRSDTGSTAYQSTDCTP